MKGGEASYCYRLADVMKRGMTYDDFDAMCERLNALNFKCGAWWPTLDDVKKCIEPNIKSNMEFAIWITETASEPKTEEERQVKHYLLQLINNNLRLKEDDEEV